MPSWTGDVPLPRSIPRKLTGSGTIPQCCNVLCCKMPFNDKITMGRRGSVDSVTSSTKENWLALKSAIVMYSLLLQ